MIYYFETIDSTNKYIKEHVDELHDFDIVSTGFQSSGKGRNDHVWIGKPNQNIYTSILIKDKEIIASYSALSIAVGVIVLRFLSRFVKKDKISLKWPNDVYVNGRKICGILLEGKLPEYIVIGIGININQDIFDIDTATSLSLETSQTYDLENIRNEFHSHLLDELKQFISHKNEYIETFNKHNYLLDKKVSFNYNGQNETGIARSINSDGSLQVEQDNKVINVFFDEVNTIR